MPITSASMPRAASVRANLAFLRLLEAAIETLQAENVILRRQLAAAETRAAQAAITERLGALTAERTRRPWRRRLVG
jgi:hypothetical protein